MSNVTIMSIDLRSTRITKYTLHARRLSSIGYTPKGWRRPLCSGPGP